MKVTEIERRNGVRMDTLNKWFRGPTRRPCASTVRAVLRAIGADLVVTMPERDPRADVPRQRSLKIVHGGKR